jgi:hypothetical protein
LTPRLLRLPLLTVLGPRAGIARKKRIKLLMPSYSMGHPFTAKPHEWAEARMAPVEWWMTVSAGTLCRHLGIDAAELRHYQEAWRMTTGDRWQRLVLSPTATAGGSSAECSGSGGASGGGGGAAEGALQLVKSPNTRLDDAVRGPLGWIASADA